MFLTLNHQKLEAYTHARKLLTECYKLTAIFPTDEKFGLTSQIRRAAISVVLNLAEGSSRKSEPERKRFFEISRSSIVEIDSALDAADDLNYLKEYNLTQMGEQIVHCFKLANGLIKS